MSDRLFVGTRKGLLRIRRGGRNGWHVDQTDFLGATVPMLCRDDRDGRVYAAVGHGHFGMKMHRSEDDGGTWAECAVPEYPAPPADRPPDLCPVRGIDVPWKLELIWALETGGPAQAGQLWCGTIPGGLFRSNDRGATWELVRALWDLPNRAKWAGGGYDFPGIHSIAVHPARSDEVAVGVSCGGVWITEDNGATWNGPSEGMRAAYLPPAQQFDPDMQDPHRLVRCPGEPEKLWVQHHNGIFRSVDGGRQWTEIEEAGPSTFGFAVVVHPEQGDTVWFAPAISDEVRVPVDRRLVVTRTRDGGATFDVLGHGLPEVSYDLIYRHGMDVDATGQSLVMASTTGSIWMSHDQGETWQTVATNLPPIYTVRYA